MLGCGWRGSVLGCGWVILSEASTSARKQSLRECTLGLDRMRRG